MLCEKHRILRDAAGCLPRKNVSNKINVHMTLHLNALDRTWLVALLLLPSSFSQTPHRPTPGAPKDFAVMAWGDSPSDPEQLRGMREAGLSISGFCRVEDLERVRAAGLTCFVSDKLVNRDSQ